MTESPLRGARNRVNVATILVQSRGVCSFPGRVIHICGLSGSGSCTGQLLRLFGEDMDVLGKGSSRGSLESSVVVLWPFL